jgi:integrase
MASSGVPFQSIARGWRTQAPVELESEEHRGRRARALRNDFCSGWVFPSERIVTPLLPDNVLRRCIHPCLEPLGLDWINFAALRRSHSTLDEERGTAPKIIADQQGHGLGVHFDRYVDSSVVRKQKAVAALWSDFKALKSEPSASN